jgi:hypothetical protein
MHLQKPRGRLRILRGGGGMGGVSGRMAKVTVPARRRRILALGGVQGGRRRSSVARK